jgi:hypothetical protein
MVFNDTTTKNGAIQECEAWLFGSDYGAISGNTKLLQAFTVKLNQGVTQTLQEIFKTDGRWQYDSSTYTDITLGKADLVDGQRRYKLDSSHLIIEGFEIQDSSGDYYTIKQIDYRDLRERGISESEFYKTNGKPAFYDLKGDIVTLYPAPSASDVTLTDGIKISFKREAEQFAYTDTNKEIGVPSSVRDLPVLFACATHAKQNSMTAKARELDAMITQRKLDLKTAMSARNKDKTLRIRPAYRSAK